MKRLGDRSAVAGGWPVELTRGVVQVLDRVGRPVGTGFVVGPRLLVTCAHILTGHGRDEPPWADPVTVMFAHLDGAARTVRVDPQGWRGPGDADIVFLRLGEPVPAQAQPLALGSSLGVGGHRVKAFGFPVNAPSGGHYGYGVAGDQIVGDGGSPLLQLTECTEVTEGFSGGPVLDERTGLVIGMVTSISRPDPHGRGRATAYAIPAETLREACPELTVSEICPYRGLEAFTSADALWFYGRGRAVTAVLSSLRRDRRFVALLGPSGAGKSSLLHAGVLPALAHGAVPGSDRWECLSIRPAADPFAQLDQAGLVGTASELGAAARRWLDQHPEQERLVVVIDQFDELLVATPPDLSTALFDQLTMVNEQEPAVTVIIGLRDDFYGRLAAAAPGLMRLVEQALVNIPAVLDAEELHAIISQPAAVVGLTLEPGLVERITSDTVMAAPSLAVPGGGAAITVLPLLEFALTELWRRRADGRLTHQAYEQIGGVVGGLARWCDQAYQALPAAQRPLVRRVVTSLVRLGDEAANIPPTRQRRTIDQLRVDPREPAQGGDSEVDAVVAALASQRLLVTSRDPISGEPFVELVHETLIREWGLLGQWLDEDREGLLLARKLTTAAHEWSEMNRDEGALYRGARLADTRAWVQHAQPRLSTLEDEFLTASIEYAEETKRQKRRRAFARRMAFIGLVVVLVLTVAAVGFGLFQQHLAAQRRIEALSRMVADEASQAAAADPSLAMQLSLAAYRIAPTLEARDSLLQASTLHTATQLLGHSGAFNAVATSPDGHILAAGSADQIIRLYDLSSPSAPALLSSLTDHIGAITAVAFSPDGCTLASGSTDHTIRLWDLTDLHHPVLLAMLIDQTTTATSAIAVTAVAFSLDGHTLASGSTDHTAQLWDLTNLHHPSPSATLTGHNSSVNTVAFSPDGHTLASGSDDRTVRLWDISDPHHPTTSALLTGHTDYVHGVAFSPDGHTLASASRDTTVQLWDVSDTHRPTQGATLTGPTVSVDAVAFSRDGHVLASGSDDGLVRIWDLTDTRHPTALPPLSGHTGLIGAVAFTPDGRALASGGSDGTVRLWNLTDPGHPPVILTESLNSPQNIGNALDTVAFSPDGHSLASGGNDHLVRLWDLTDRHRPTLSAVLSGPTNFIEAVTFSPNGRTLAIADGDHTVRLWDLTNPHNPLPAATLTGHTSVVESVAFSPDGHTLASSSSDHTIRLWNITDSQHPTEMATLTGHANVVEWVAFSPDGHTLASGSDDHTVRLWDVTDPHHPSATGTLTGHTDDIEMVAFSPDGHTLASASQDGTVRLWDLNDLHHPATAATLTGHTARVEAVMFNPDGRTLASASFDGTIRLWDLTDPAHPAVVLRHSGEVEAVVYTLDGHTLASGSSDGTIRLWDTNPEQTANEICGLMITPLTPTQWKQYVPDEDYNPPCRLR